MKERGVRWLIIMLTSKHRAMATTKYIIQDVNICQVTKTGSTWEISNPAMGQYEKLRNIIHSQMDVTSAAEIATQRNTPPVKAWIKTSSTALRKSSTDSSLFLEKANLCEDL